MIISLNAGLQLTCRTTAPHNAQHASQKLAACKNVVDDNLLCLPLQFHYHDLEIFCVHSLQALENTGSTDWPAETYNVTISNPNMVSVKKSWGWNLTRMADGTAAGTMTLVGQLCLARTAYLRARISTES